MYLWFHVPFSHGYNCLRMEEGKETREMKRQKSSRRDRQRRGEEQVKWVAWMCSAPYNEFYVLNICCSDFILSKQWKDLWKRLTILTLFHHEFVKAASFNKFASEVLSARDASISLLNNPRNSQLFWPSFFPVRLWHLSGF